MLLLARVAMCAVVYSLHVAVPENVRAEAVRLAAEAKKKEEMDSDSDDDKAK